MPTAGEACGDYLAELVGLPARGNGRAPGGDIVRNSNRQPRETYSPKQIALMIRTLERIAEIAFEPAGGSLYDIRKVLTDAGLRIAERPAPSADVDGDRRERRSRQSPMLRDLPARLAIERVFGKNGGAR